ncbi:MAG: cytochrome c1 [Dokdonella sp.]
MTNLSMTTMLRSFALAIFGCALSVGSAFAADESAGIVSANTSITNQGSLQRGAQLFVNYCSGCHSLRFMRYSRMAEDLGLSEQQVMDNLNFTGAKYGDKMHATMTAADGTKWFGAPPPDLSLEVRAKGADWVYSYLRSFYVDPSRPVGWNNVVFPNASMPNVLWELQGIQTAAFKPAAEEGADPEFDAFSLQQPGQLSPGQFDEAARDITAFLQYVSEPAALQRHAIGIWVLLYLILFTILAWFLKHEYWKDVH